MAKNLPAKQEMQVQSLNQGDPRSRKWQPTSIFLPFISHEQWSLVGYSSTWDHKESNMTEQLNNSNPGTYPGGPGTNRSVVDEARM